MSFRQSSKALAGGRRRARRRRGEEMGSGRCVRGDLAGYAKMSGTNNIEMARRGMYAQAAPCATQACASLHTAEEGGGANGAGASSAFTSTMRNECEGVARVVGSVQFQQTSVLSHEICR